MGKSVLIAEPGKQELTITRVFDAPKELLWRAHAEPDLLRQWLGPHQLTTTVLELDVRPGGSYRFVQRDPEGNEYGFRGVCHSAVPAEQIIQTFEFEGMPGHVSLETTTFEEVEGGKTRLISHSVFQSVEDRDGMISAGMQTGVDEGNERLDELLKQLQRGEVPA